MLEKTSAPSGAKPFKKYRLGQIKVALRRVPGCKGKLREESKCSTNPTITDVESDHNCSQLKLNACFPIRYAVAVLGFLGIAFQYMLKVTLSVAIVGMVSKPDKDEDAVLDDTCPVTVTNTSSSSQTGEFDWDEEMQGHILSSYYYGYVAMQIVGGHSAAKFGGRWVYGAGLFAAGLLTLLGPLAAYAGPVVFMVSRIGVGLASGVIIPAMHVMFTKWFPDHERQRLSGAIFSGYYQMFTIIYELFTFLEGKVRAKANYMGTLLSMAVSGTMVKNLGWPSVFYVFGGISTVTIIPWVYFVYSEPESHPRITEKELRYILENTGCSMKEKSSKEPADSQDNSNRTNPWIMIPLTPGMWAHCLVLFAVGWVNYTLLSELPTYMQNILHFDIDEAGFISALPYLFGWMSCSIYSFLTQWFIQKGMRKIVAFKIWDAIACIGPALCLLGVTLLGCDVTGIVAMFVLTMVTRCAIYGGSYLNHIDMFPHAAGTAAGIAQTFITVPGIITPLVTSAFISGQAVILAKASNPKKAAEPSSTPEDIQDTTRRTGHWKPEAVPTGDPLRTSADPVSKVSPKETN
ncbi:sialin-like [Schistocerca piceifrons]|uniref:sialin-like n=1 Tax=Schistocerca piceifrons TaxID=274613 RepID=UPI001F5E9914|nr:sialin-like [Schistocerca piceifrons]